MRAVLEGIKVIECTSHSYQASTGGAMLAELGADVIHVEEPVKGDPVRGIQFLSGIKATLPDGSNPLYQLSNHSKRSITLDLKKQEGHQLIRRLISKADVFLCSFRLDAAKRLGLDYPTLSQHNPTLIYAHASGFGPKGPDSQEPVHDYIGQARSGFMHMIGEPNSPPAVFNVAIGDQVGGIMLAYGVLAALIARERYGIGQELDAAQLGSLIFLQGQGIGFFLMVGQEPPRLSRAKAPGPLWNHYQCKDGKWIALGVLQTERHWHDFCHALGIEDMENDPRLNTSESRREHREFLVSILERAFATKDSDEWVAILSEKADFPFSRINDYSDVASDPQALLNDYIVELDHPNIGKMRTIGYPVRMEKTPWKMRGPAPELGQHTEEILLENGSSWDEILQLKEQGVI